MDSAESNRLMAECQHRKRIYEYAALKMMSAATSADCAQFMILKTLADEAKLDLDRAEAEITQHQETARATTPGGSRLSI